MDSLFAPELASALSITLIIAGTIAIVLLGLFLETGMSAEKIIIVSVVVAVAIGLVLGVSALGAVAPHGWWILLIAPIVAFIAKEYLEADYWLERTYRRTRRAIRRVRHRAATPAD